MSSIVSEINVPRSLKYGTIMHSDRFSWSDGTYNAVRNNPVKSLCLMLLSRHTLETRRLQRLADNKFKKFRSFGLMNRCHLVHFLY
jgi:hypothetical protein